MRDNMTLQEFDEELLGKKHQNYNTKLKNALAHKAPLQPITNDGNDIENLLKIDIACSCKNVEYLLDVFKTNDMLYVSRAIKRSTWLITDNQYTPFINIQYLSTQLFPYMMTKAINKLTHKIRLNLRDHMRVEEFYKYYEKSKQGTTAFKWLQYCSVHFVEDVIKNISYTIPVQTLKRLCKKSITILKIYLQNETIYTSDVLCATLFLLNTQPEKYLDILESADYTKYPDFGIKYTNTVMKSFKTRVLTNFEKYIYCIHFPTFAKHLNKGEIRKILMQDSNIKDIQYLFTYDNMKHLIKKITTGSKFACLKKSLIDRIEIDECEYCVMYKAILTMNWYSFKTYRFYKFAPFEVAFTELKKLIRVESSPAERNAIIIFLIKCAAHETVNLQSILQYYYQKHINEPFKFKIIFINCFLNKINVNLDDKNWDILNQLFHSVELYTKLDNNTQKCVHAVIVHNAIVGERNPNIIEEKFLFNTLKTYRNKLNIEENEKVFDFLYNYYLIKMNKKEIVNNFELTKVVHMVSNILQLLVDWEKEIKYYPLVINKIKELAKVKHEKGWNTNLSSLYNIKKTWRKYMFEESIILYPSEEVCVNALKHDTGLLTRYKSQVVNISQAESLARVHSKLRVYWTHSITADWTNMNLQSLNNISSHKFIIRNLMTILPQVQFKAMLIKYIPIESKIDWNEPDAEVRSIRKYIASNMYLARPLVSIDSVLLYAKGDYLQYTVPSLYSILHTSSQNQSYLDIPKLLKSPGSLQKYGIRFAFNSINCTEVVSMFVETWKLSKNSSIRALLFEQTFRAMCKADKAVVADKMLSILRTFINDLSAGENKTIYNTLGQVKDVPENVAGKFFMSSYTFLKGLPPKAFCEPIIKRLVEYAPEIIEFLDDKFVIDMLKDVGEKLKSECHYLNVISAYLLCCNNDEVQHKRFKTVLLPLLDHYLSLWNEMYNDKKYIETNFRILFRNLGTELKNYILKRKQIVPVKLFLDIQTKLESILLKHEKYVILTGWKLKVVFIKLLEQQNSTFFKYSRDQRDNNTDIIWDNLLLKILPSFAKTCYDILKQDASEFLNIIYIFNDVIQETLEDLGYTNRIEFLIHVLKVSSSLEDYIHVIYMCPSHPNNAEVKSFRELRELLKQTTPLGARIHFHHKFDNYDKV